MNIQSNVSFRPWPDIPATFESLNDDTLTTMLQFVGDKSYRSFGGVNKRCKEVYLSSGMTKKTFLFGYGPLSAIKDKIERAGEYHELQKAVGKGVLFFNRQDIFEWALEEQNRYVLKGICNVAAEEGRIDILNKVLNNVNDEDWDDKRFIFEVVGEHAAQNGNLDVLEWIESKKFDIDKDWCARYAAQFGHVHILQWLQEEKGLELFIRLYNYAAKGGQLHVLKWLREQEVDWEYHTFYFAARKGNLDILQWLHDEGSPWPDDHSCRVGEFWLKPEVIDWCHVNGYGSRVYRGFDFFDA